ncbi:AraC family transcriptional regulator [Pelagicoccus sp. NFK12]|uniref:AraC family transcriptional regulator n=1 Tax=Pelagicoccus enzymogenes TaxID=2773457 RepID=A0A927F3V7_9BACT|nr:AraC family transcriptional regulator [Pelagicoccus enzymogenes]MBD5777932.1 AraC family transcriptional regulator [Pelagicoccus enzymogenes]
MDNLNEAEPESPASSDDALTRMEGFRGQKLIRIPADLERSFAEGQMSRQLYLTDIGFYPPVDKHRVERESPLESHVLIYCVGGEGWCRLGNRRQSLKRHSFVVLPAGEAHAYGNRLGESWEIYWVHFKGEQSSLMAERLCDGRFGTGILLSPRRELLQLFQQTISDLEQEASREAYSFANARLWHLLGDMVYRRRFDLGGEGRAIDRSLEIMKARVEESISLADLSREVGLSSTYFCRLFKKRMDQAPIDYFIRLKIQRACQYLDFSDMAVQEVAMALGYEDPYYFSRVFKRIMGVSPLQYRKGNQH